MNRLTLAIELLTILVAGLFSWTVSVLLPPFSATLENLLGMRPLPTLLVMRTGLLLHVPFLLAVGIFVLFRWQRPSAERRLAGMCAVLVMLAFAAIVALLGMVMPFVKPVVIAG